MKASKLIILVGGLVGILSFFLPLVSVQRTNLTAKVSAFQIIKGLDAVSVAVDGAQAHDTVEVQTKAEAQQDLGAIKGIVLAVFAPALLLALIGGIGVKRKKFGRGAGTLALLLGLIGLAIAAVLKSAAGGDGGIGLTLLLLTGVSGTVGGLLALIKPERGVVVQPQLATLPRAA